MKKIKNDINDVVKETYVKRSKKRKRILVEYEDGSVEEYKEGILISLTQVKGKPEGTYEVLGMHCNTNDKFEEYCQAIGYFAMETLKHQETLEELSTTSEPKCDKDLN